jgi:hypothetical protein
MSSITLKDLHVGTSDVTDSLILADVRGGSSYCCDCYPKYGKEKEKEEYEYEKEKKKKGKYGYDD